MPVSPPKAQANRRNAKRSTGPRTPAGKARSAGNAMRHGLAAARADWASSTQVQQLASMLTGGKGDVLALAESREMAEATLEIAHIRRLRTAIINRAIADDAAPHRDTVAAARQIIAALTAAGGATRANQDSRERLSKAERMALAFAAVAGDLERLDRYERRALSRRKMAARRLAHNRTPLRLDE